jgi:DNA-binding transcriptional MerR regulator
MNGMTIDDLARTARLPVRTIREYHTLRLLPPPQRRGRVGIYDAGHRQRLELIGRLQRRGYSLAGIRDLLQAWEDGTGLTAVLGIEPGQTALDETPLRLTQDEMSERLPALSGPALSQAISAGLVQPHGETFLVRSPALLALVADGAAAGIPVSDMLDLAGLLRRELACLADLIAGLMMDRLLPPLEAGPNPAGLRPLLRRGRQLLLQSAASTLADQLGTALIARSDSSERGAALRAAIDEIRIGAVTDSAGRISRQAGLS